MTVLKSVEKPPQKHTCDLPYGRQFEYGSLWHCDECGKIWRSVSRPRDDGYKWHCETQRERWRRWKSGEVYKEELR